MVLKSYTVLIISALVTLLGYQCALAQTIILNKPGKKQLENLGIQYRPLQSKTAIQIKGAVIDSAKNGVPFAQVIIFSNGIESGGVVTDEFGFFSYTIPAGSLAKTFSIKVVRFDFSPLFIEDIPATKNDFYMQLTLHYHPDNNRNNLFHQLSVSKQ